MLRPLSLLSCLALALAGCGGDDDDGGATSGEATSRPHGSRPSRAARAGCKDVEQPEPRDRRRRREAEAAPLDPAKTYDGRAADELRRFTIQLDQKTSPNAAASFVSLARSGFFDDTIFHRIVPGFVIQGGDPTGERHRRPRLLDARRAAGGRRLHRGRGGDGQDRRRAARHGRQPVLRRHRRRTPGLPPDYALLGKVTRGMDVVQAIGKLGDPAERWRRHAAPVGGDREGDGPMSR